LPANDEHRDFFLPESVLVWNFSACGLMVGKEEANGDTMQKAAEKTGNARTSANVSGAHHRFLISRYESQQLPTSRASIHKCDQRGASRSSSAQIENGKEPGFIKTVQRRVCRIALYSITDII
jgi:hypothetical protein